MTDLSAVQMSILMRVFIGSGFVRAGLGFGGTALALPFAQVADAHVVVAPVIGGTIRV